MARFRSEDLRDAALSELRGSYPTLLFDTPQSDRADDFRFTATFSEAAVREIEDYAVSQNLVT